MSRITISQEASTALREMALAARVTPRTYVELLLNYAYSIHSRPGSWEACEPFDPGTYLRADIVADRWWHIYGVRP